MHARYDALDHNRLQTREQVPLTTYVTVTKSFLANGVVATHISPHLALLDAALGTPSTANGAAFSIPHLIKVGSF